MQKVTSLRSTNPPIQQPIVHINTFGAFLRYLREREQMSQSELVSSFAYFFKEYNVESLTLTPDMYRKLEKGKRAAQYEELLPLYAVRLLAMILNSTHKREAHSCAWRGSNWKDSSEKDPNYAQMENGGSWKFN